MRASTGILISGAFLFACGNQGGPPGNVGGGGGTASGGAGAVGSPGGTGGVPIPVTGGSGPSAGAGGSDGGSGGTAPPVTGDASGGSPAPDGGAPPIAGNAPYGCTGCKRLFDGKTLDGWLTVPGAWVVKEGGILASTGKAADIFTKEDLGDYRIFFQVRHLPAMGGKDHQPCTVLFGKRPADPTMPQRGLKGAQFQPPNGYSWDYGVGGTFTNPPGKMKLDAAAWNQCEIVVKAAGSFRAACCTVAEPACKTFEVLSWKGPGSKHPFDIMMHNAGLFDEYREIWIEQNPTVDGFLSGK